MKKIAHPTDDQQRYVLNSPTAMPHASGFLWNPKMMLHMNCRGYAVAQFMQPEPAKYSHAPNLEAKTFMQPEQPFYAHHPGRFFYVKDRDSGRLFSAPHEPVRQESAVFVFSVGKSDIQWRVEHDDIRIDLRLDLAKEDTVELWSADVTNLTERKRNISLYPYFTVGYMSWMNQSAKFSKELNAIVCKCVTPYQKYQDYDKIKHLKDLTFLLSNQKPDGFETIQQDFEGEGGLHNPSGISNASLQGRESLYETPVCAFQYDWALEPGETKNLKLVFGPSKTYEEVAAIKNRYLKDGAFQKARNSYAKYIQQGESDLLIHTPSAKLDNLVNHWLSRQIFYHGETNRLSTDPQTRNYLQDNMGMSYIRPEVMRQAFLTALSQQKATGEMPDGILIHEKAELKYINQVPHTDHCVWVPICLKAYLDETGDYALLEEKVGFSDSDKQESISEHIDRAMRWLLKNRDHRGLNYINQGDWCDPMNMVGYKGKGVSGWLSLASAYALNAWADIKSADGDGENSNEFRQGASELNKAVNDHIWNGSWYSRGITDDNVLFGIPEDAEGRIFLNPQGWAILSGATDSERRSKIIKAVKKELETPYGVEMLAPSFTAMREDVGRVTQKHPGSAENGSVYNHAAAFYIYALYCAKEGDRAYELLDRMIPGPDEEDLLHRGQLPVFIPNYYRGAFRQFERTAGRSSQLFNTGTVSWIFRCLIDGLFGLRGEPEGLRVDPCLPDSWNEVKVIRRFRGSELHIDMRKQKEHDHLTVFLNGILLPDNLIEGLVSGKVYKVEVLIPA